MTDYGITAAGFVRKPLAVIKAEIQDDLRDNVNSKLNLLDTSVLGQIVGVFAGHLDEAWQVMEAVNSAFDPDAASDTSLDVVSAITGATRTPALKGTVVLDRLYADNGVTIPINSIVGVGAEGNRWVTMAAVTNSTGYASTVSTTAEAQSTGALAGYAGEIDTIITPVSGWNAKAALTNTVAETYALDGTSLTLKVDRGGVETANFAGGNPWSAADVATQIKADTTADAYAVGTYVRVASETDGEGSSIEITGGTANAVLVFGTTEIKGFNSVDADAGAAVEEDPAFRLRRELLLRLTGAASVEAIRSALLDIVGMLQALVIENTGIVVDANGLPGKSFESICQQTSWTSDEEAEVGETIWLKKAAGIETFGSETTTITDSMGYDHDMKWSKPTEIPIYIALTITTDDDYPANGDDLVAQALVDYGDTLNTDENVIALKFKGIPLDEELGVAGVTDVTAFTIDTVTPAVGTVNITIGVREQATFDTTRVIVTS